jgi:hypothetical protein
MVGNIRILHDSKFMILRRLHLAWLLRRLVLLVDVNEEKLELQSPKLDRGVAVHSGASSSISDCLRPPHG